MKNAIFATLAVALLLSSCGKSEPAATIPSAPSAESGAPVTGLATMVKGQVEILLPGQAEWKALAVKDPVPPGSKLRASGDGEADLLVAEKCAVRLKPGSEITIEENRMVAGSARIHVKVDAGRLLHRFEKLGAGAEYKVTTPTAGAVIRGTEFDVTAGGEGTRVRVLKGRVAVSNEAGNVEVAEKQGTLVGAGVAPAAPQQLSSKDVDAILECNLLNFVVALQRARRIADLAEMRNIGTPLEVWAASHDGAYPATLAEADCEGYTDNWGAPYRYEQLGGGRGFVIISNGPDKQPDTEDDLEYRRE
jgi:hypothetical protein